MTDDQCNQELIKIYTQITQGKQWLEQYRGKLPVFACILGFTETGLIPGISAAGFALPAGQWCSLPAKAAAG